jgi:flavin reductase (DIM6/NTAB) family NADH-FMN oxidoreductase RutF
MASKRGDLKRLALERVYRGREPGPVVLISPVRKGRANVMTLSWHTMMEFEPPLVGCVLGRGDYSFAALKATRECVLNIPTEELAEQVVGCGNTSGRDTDKFTAFGLTPAPVL